MTAFRRRREIDLKNDLTDIVKGVLGKLIFSLFKGLIQKLIDGLRERGWVTTEEDEIL